MGNCDSASGNGAKVKKGDTIRCDLDMDAGTMSVTVAGVDQGVCFTGMAGMEIWPAVQFYSSGRSVRLLKLEGPLVASSAVVQWFSWWSLAHSLSSDVFLSHRL